MDEEELKELMTLLDAAGVRAKLCDTPVPVSANAVKCGIPTEIGDEDIDDYVMMPKALVGMHPFMMIPVDGDSMIDAGYEQGDMLRVQFDVPYHDYDNVLAWIDGRCTVKTLITDEDGARWLVPRNQSYDAILLKEDMDVRILAVVRGVEKADNRAPSREILNSIRRTKNKLRAARKLTSEQVDDLIVRMGDEVNHARQWYAVMRSMADAEIIDASDFEGFCARVCRLLPEHQHLPDAKELQRVAVFSFSKPVSMWVESDAPVRGKRFRDYLALALSVAKKLNSM